MKTATRKSTTAGGVVIKNIDGQIKIALARDAEGENKWVIPKGHVRDGETLETTAIREVREEVGVQNPQLICYLGCVTRRSIEDWGEVVQKDIHLFLMYALSSEHIKPVDFETVVESGWFSLQEAIHLIPFPEDAAFLAEKLKPLSISQG